MVDLDAALGEQLFDIAVGQSVAEVPAHGDRDHLTRKPFPAGVDDDADFELIIWPVACHTAMTNATEPARDGVGSVPLDHRIGSLC